MKPQIKYKNCKFIVKPEDRMVICVIDNSVFGEERKKVSDILLDFIFDNEYSNVDICTSYDFDKKLRMPKSFIGKAVCAEEDEWNEELGKKIAYSRAKNKLYTSFYKRANLFIQETDRRLNYMIDKFNNFGVTLDENKQRLDDEIERLLQKHEEE